MKWQLIDERKSKMTRKIKLLYPRILIPRPKPLLIFIDTFFWFELIKPNRTRLVDSLQKACESNRVNVVITELVKAELANRKRKTIPYQICGKALVTVHFNHIIANQIIQAFCQFVFGSKEILLPWEFVTRDVSVLVKRSKGFKEITKNLAKELNRVRDNFPFSTREQRRESRESLIRGIIHVERDIWRQVLQSYREMECGIERLDFTIYEEFFLTDYFTDLPGVVMPSYLLAFCLSDRKLRPNDVVDVYSMTALLPYVDLYIADKEMHYKLRRVQQDYPMVFEKSSIHCNVVSGLDESIKALEEFLNKL